MFNIGLFELLIIFFFLILFVKPEEIPKISKNLGLLYRKINRYFYNFKYEIDEINFNDSSSRFISQEKKKKKKLKGKSHEIFSLS